MNHSEYLSKAAAKAKEGIQKNWGGPFGALILHNNKIIALEHNTVLKTHNPTCHAEVNAIRVATQKLKTPFLDNCLIYSTTEPCPMCFSAIHWARIPTLVYSTTIGDVQKLGFNELPISVKTMMKQGKVKMTVLRQNNPDCLALLSYWKKLPAAHTY